MCNSIYKAGGKKWNSSRLYYLILELILEILPGDIKLNIVGIYVPHTNQNVFLASLISMLNFNEQSDPLILVYFNGANTEWDKSKKTTTQDHLEND